MDWSRCVETCAAAVRGRHDGSGDAIKTLLGLLDHKDVLVAYGAKEALQDVLNCDPGAEGPCVNDIVRDLLTPGCWRREASGFRLLLLRQLVKAECGRESMEGDSEKEKLSGRVAESSMAYLTAEYDPDLLFADLVDTLGRDHLVLLDLLVSNETHMLEYFMRYLRQLAAHWETSKKKLQMNKQLENVMSVLIRLRLEIDKLVVADLFPYGAGPLTRRLLSIERLYEEPDDDAERL
ncbi:uncharacterized protein IUM83_01825 [Phytophthora cinnamomi]|uniref:uncharacterized protein n=1 Tax=Phytophthora cinnamomi TaxID=4785 RepID=UPI00355A6D0A|nr:hypothetical protein IUM83_01825 [Phytophthora cinnamomi]